jgi:hypothetical protein
MYTPPPTPPKIKKIKKENKSKRWIHRLEQIKMKSKYSKENGKFLVRQVVCSNAENPLLFNFFHRSRLISLPHYTSQSPKVSGHVATYNINSEEFLKPTLHK